MYIYIYIVHIYIYLYILKPRVHVYVYIHMHICVYMHMFTPSCPKSLLLHVTHMTRSLSLSVYTYIYVCMNNNRYVTCACMCTHTCTEYVYIYTYMDTYIEMEIKKQYNGFQVEQQHILEQWTGIHNFHTNIYLHIYVCLSTSTYLFYICIIHIYIHMQVHTWEIIQNLEFIFNHPPGQSGTRYVYQNCSIDCTRTF